MTDTPEIQGAFPKLSRPPLREALIDIRLRKILPLLFAEKLQNLNLEGFSRVGDIRRGGVRVEMGKDRPIQASLTADDLMGARYDDASKSIALQLRRDGITLSILKGYTNWEFLRDKAHAFWRRFLDLSGPVQIARIAVRYINVIDLPMGENSENYLSAGPKIPVELPQLFQGFFQRIVVPFTDDNATAIVTQATEPATAKGFPTVLDIEVSIQCSDDGMEPSVWEKFEGLRLIKNRIFFSYVTSKALELYR